MADATNDSIVYLPGVVGRTSEKAPDETRDGTFGDDEDAAMRVLGDLARNGSAGWLPYQIGKIAAGESRWREAIECFDEALVHGSHNSRIHLAKAVALRNLGEGPVAVARHPRQSGRIALRELRHSARRPVLRGLRAIGGILRALARRAGD